MKKICKNYREILPSFRTCFLVFVNPWFGPAMREINHKNQLDKNEAKTAN